MLMAVGAQFGADSALGANGADEDPLNEGQSLLPKGRYREVIALISRHITGPDGRGLDIPIDSGDWQVDFLGHALVFRELSEAQLKEMYLADLYNVRGIADFRLAEREKALNDFRFATTLNAWHSQSYTNQGVTLIALNKFDEALKVLNRAIAVNKRQLDAYKSRSEVYRARKQFELEQKDLETYHFYRSENSKQEINLRLLDRFAYAFNIIAKKPRTARTYTACGVIHWENLRLKESEDAFQQAIKLDPRLPEAHSAYGMLLLWEKKYPEALKQFDQALAIAPRLPAARMNRARIRAILKQYKEAIDDYNQILADNPASKDLKRISYANRGFCYGELKQYTKGVHDITTALQLNPSNADKVTYWNNRGRCYEGMGSKALALRDYDQALQLSPNLKSVLERRGKIMLSMGEFEQATADLNVSRSDRVDDVCKEPPSQSELKKQIEHYDRLIKLFPASTESTYNRGLLYLTLGDSARAAADMLSVIAHTKQCNTTSDFAACFGVIALRLNSRLADADKLIENYARLPRFDKAPVEVQHFIEKGKDNLELNKIIAGNLARRTRTLTLYGLEAFSRGDKVKCLEYLSAVKNNGDPSMDEFILAISYLKKLGK